MKLFLDTSVLLAAAGSAAGASREVFRLASARSWKLITSPYALDEAAANVARLSARAAVDWPHLRTALIIKEDVLTLDRLAVFAPAKDRPILFSALAWADVLLTLDRSDFQGLLGSSFYGLGIRTPGQFLSADRASATR